MLQLTRVGVDPGPESGPESILSVGVIGTLVAVILLILLNMSGCGLKGPLSRTDENGKRIEQRNSTTANRKKTPSFERAPAPQAQKDGSGSTSPSAPPSPSTPPAVDPDRPAAPTPTP